MAAPPGAHGGLAPPDPPDIRTARLRLRARTLADLEAIVAMDADPVVRRFIGGPLDPVRHREEVRRRIVEGRPEPHASWAVEWRDRPGLIGLCGLSTYKEAGLTQIDWRLLPSAWGRGVATEAARAVLARALGPLGLSAVVALIRPENRASIRVAEKAGMARSGTAQFKGVPQLLFRAVRTRDEA